jgi:hypothetical protein
MKKILNFFLFSNLYISFGAVVMCYTTCVSLQLEINECEKNLFYFVFFATLSSYCLHWGLTFGSKTPRLDWTTQYRPLLFLFFAVATLAFFFIGLKILTIGKYLVGLAVLAFLYTAPKIPIRPFVYLRGLAIGKTLYLSATWTIVTTILPVLMNGQTIGESKILYFIANRFFLINTVCVLFDYKDRQEDRGIKNLVTYMTEPILNIYLGLNTFLFSVTLYHLFFYYQFNTLIICDLAIPFAFLLLTFSKSKKTQNDYWYFLWIDSLMFLSGILLSIIRS